jgi:hypothetical protein
MAWGWETANICQSKLSWVLLGFGEWKADKASPHTLGCTRQEESREDGTGGGGLRGGLLRFPPAPRGYVHSSTFNSHCTLVHTLWPCGRMCSVRGTDHGAPPPLGSPVAVIVILG